MTPCERPRLPIPEPLRGLEFGTFTHSSIVDRLPEIGRRTLAENDFRPVVVAQLETLLSEIPYGRIRMLADITAPDAMDWTGYLMPYLGQDWLHVPWFFAENYFYRRIMEATGYFEPGPGQHVDPFIHQKQQGLVTTERAVHDLSQQAEKAFAQQRVDRKLLASLLAVDLWGNQADLSMWPAGFDDQHGHQDESQQADHTLVDERELVIAYLSSRQEKRTRVDVLLDNAGFELVADICLAGVLLHQGLADTVYLHAKSHPTFVSDAMIQDVTGTIAFLSGSNDPPVAALGRQLKTYLDGNRIQLGDHLFWNSPLPAWEMPDSLRQELALSDLIVSKGDANYRRLLGDRHWPFTTPFSDVVCTMPAPLVALRTLKSEVAIGLQPGQPEAAAEKDENWLTNGQWGVIQFHLGSTSLVP